MLILQDLNHCTYTWQYTFLLTMYTLLYADDTLVFAESPEDMQLALNEVSDYCNRWAYL